MIKDALAPTPDLEVLKASIAEVSKRATELVDRKAFLDKYQAQLYSDIRRLQGEGRTEQEIISTLRQQGISPREIIDALSQSKIKEAVGEAAGGFGLGKILEMFGGGGGALQSLLGLGTMFAGNQMAPSVPDIPSFAGLPSVQALANVKFRDFKEVDPALISATENDINNIEMQEED